MKPEELMIGDWVSLFQGNPDGSSCNVQVTFIGEYGEVGIEGCEEYTSANCNLLFPIPLTPEILEQNGFEYFDNPVSQTQDKSLMTDIINGHYVEIRLDRKEIAIWYDYDKNNDGVYSDCLFPLPYWLHDFQHALRLCGINKEITI